MQELEEALSRILAWLPPPSIERVPLREATRRVLVESISAPLDLPLFDNSAMDGYAVRKSDVAAAKPGSPVNLNLVGRVAAGETFSGKLSEGQCVRLFTGSALPHGADAVVMQEDTHVDNSNPDVISVFDCVQPWENVRRRGEEVTRGETLASCGDVLTAVRLALLATMGLRAVGVGRRPVVGLLATGSELREAGEALGPGQIYESNRAALSPLIARAGGQAVTFPLVPDELRATRKALEDAFGQCDMVVTSGGVSVGEMDFVKAAFEELGGELQFWKVAIKPGRPFVFGRHQKKLLFGLPGNPVSALVTFLLLVRPAIWRWQGAAELALPAYPAILSESLANSGHRRHFMRVRVDAAGKVCSAGRQASHALGSLATADGLVDVPANTTFFAGTTVRVLHWD